MEEKCGRCGSTDIARGVSLMDSYGKGGWSRPAEIEVHGKPDAWMFKDTLRAQVLIDFCGDCGHADLRVSDSRLMYEKYARSTGS